MPSQKNIPHNKRKKSTSNNFSLRHIAMFLGAVIGVYALLRDYSFFKSGEHNYSAAELSEFENRLVGDTLPSGSLIKLYSSYIDSISGGDSHARRVKRMMEECKAEYHEKPRPGSDDTVIGSMGYSQQQQGLTFFLYPAVDKEPRNRLAITFRHEAIHYDRIMRNKNLYEGQCLTAENIGSVSPYLSASFYPINQKEQSNFLKIVKKDTEGVHKSLLLYRRYLNHADQLTQEQHSQVQTIIEKTKNHRPMEIHAVTKGGVFNELVQRDREGYFRSGKILPVDDRVYAVDAITSSEMIPIDVIPLYVYAFEVIDAEKQIARLYGNYSKDPTLAYLSECYAIAKQIKSTYRQDPFMFTTELEAYLLQNQQDEAFEYFYPGLYAYTQERANGNCPQISSAH